MVDVGGKAATTRRARACGKIYVSTDVVRAVAGGTNAKGDVFAAARIAGIMAAKQTSSLIPLCHPLPLTKCSVELTLDAAACCIEACCTAQTTHVTGVEMEALTGVSVALLTVYDMCKAIDKSMIITDVHLLEKTGGKSGDYHFENGEKSCGQQ